VALGSWWSAAPPQYLGRSFASELEQVVATVLGLERYAEVQLTCCAAGRHRFVDYERFCADPSELTGWISGAYEARGVSLEPSGEPLPAAFDASRLEPARRAELEAKIAPIAARLAGEQKPLRPAGRGA
jgi:hypothetical protein